MDETVRQLNAILVAGELAGLSARLDIDVLEKFLENPPKDFRYAVWCRAAVAFAKAVKEAK